MKKLLLIPLLHISLITISQTVDDIQKQIDSLELLQIELTKQLKQVENDLVVLKRKKSEVWANGIAGAKLIFLSGGALYDLENNYKVKQTVSKGTIVMISRLLKDGNYEVLHDGALYFLRKSVDVIPLEDYHLKQANKTTTTKITAKVKDKPSPAGKIVGEIPQDRTVVLLSYKSNYFEVNYQDIYGYASEIYFKETKGTTELKLEYKKEKLIEVYGDVNGLKIFNHRIWIGMTASMLKDSRGTPDDINRTVLSTSTHEQWVYGNSLYVYLEDGIVTSWQD